MSFLKNDSFQHIQAIDIHLINLIIKYVFNLRFLIVANALKTVWF